MVENIGCTCCSTAEFLLPALRKDIAMYWDLRNFSRSTCHHKLRLRVTTCDRERVYYRTIVRHTHILTARSAAQEEWSPYCPIPELLGHCQSHACLHSIGSKYDITAEGKALTIAKSTVHSVPRYREQKHAADSLILDNIKFNSALRLHNYNGITAGDAC